MSICRGIAGRRIGKIKGVFIHNDAGGDNCNFSHYVNWLPSTDLTNGFAHAYVCSDGVVTAEDEDYRAWHCGEPNGNNNYYSVEVCQSMGDEATFRQNEEKAFKFIAEKFKKWGLEPNEQTVRLHREVFATACPHRSMELHGRTVRSVKAYFIKQIKEYMNPKPTSVNATIQDNTGHPCMRMSVERVQDELYRIRDAEHGWCLTAGGTQDGATARFAAQEKTDRQLWGIKKKSYKLADYAMLESVAAPGLFLSVEDNGQEGKENLKMWSDLHNMKQKFYVREESDGKTLIIHAFSGKCVAAK